MQFAANLHIHGVISLLERFDLAIMSRPADQTKTFNSYFAKTNVFGNMVGLSGRSTKSYFRIVRKGRSTRII